MSEERKKVLQRFEDRLARLEALRHEMPARWQVFHLHNALNALPHDHGTADLHLDEFDRHDLAKEYPDLAFGARPVGLGERFEIQAGQQLLVHAGSEIQVLLTRRLDPEVRPR